MKSDPQPDLFEAPIVLSPADAQVFVAALLNPPEPAPALIRAAYIPPDTDAPLAIDPKAQAEVDAYRAGRRLPTYRKTA